MDNSMEKHQTKIGKNLIEILMYSMYDDAKVVLREYVQNAYDAINEAVDLGILEAAKYGYVNIILDNRHRSVHINDNGTGIVKKFAAKKLLDIADSFKDGKNTAGHYGIGRLTGLQFCERLIFRTSAKGEDEYTEVVFDSNMARMILNDTNDHRNAEEVVNSIATVTFGPEEIDKHYFEIEMENIRKDYSQLLDEDSVREYLEEVAPIDYSTQFKNLLINRAEIPPHIKSQRDNLKYIQLSINNLVDIRKRFGLEIEGTGDKIKTLHYFDIIDDEYGLLAWGWFAITAFTKAIPIKDLNRGIRLRKKNIQVGTSNLLDKYFDESRGNNYFYGEVFAIHENLRPSSDRTALVATPEAGKFYELLKSKFKDLHKLYHLANELKGGLKDVAYGARLASGKGDEDFEVAKTKLEEGVEKMQKAEKKGLSSVPASKFVIDIYKNSASKSVKEFEQKTSSKPNITIDLDEEKENSAPEMFNKDAIVHTSSPVPQIIDIFAPLKEKYEVEDVKLIRKIFASFTKNCPVANRALLEELKKKAIKELSKG
jgi:molecular chaperone HtpG